MRARRVPVKLKASLMTHLAQHIYKVVGLFINGRHVDHLHVVGRIVKLDPLELALLHILLDRDLVLLLESLKHALVFLRFELFLLPLERLFVDSLLHIDKSVLNEWLQLAMQAVGEKRLSEVVRYLVYQRIRGSIHFFHGLVHGIVAGTVEAFELPHVQLLLYAAQIAHRCDQKLIIRLQSVQIVDNYVGLQHQNLLLLVLLLQVVIERICGESRCHQTIVEDWRIYLISRILDELLYVFELT